MVLSQTHTDTSLLPQVTHLETTGEFVAELRKSIAGEVTRLSDTNIKSDRFIAFVIGLRNEWSNRITSGVSIDILLQYLEIIREYISLLPESERARITKNMDIYQGKPFGYDTILQVGIAPENIISSLLQYPSKKSKFQSGESIHEMDNSTFVAYILTCDIAARFAHTIRRSGNKDAVRESKEHLAEAFNILNIYWYSPLVQQAIRDIKPQSMSNECMLQYSDLKSILDSITHSGEESMYPLENTIKKGMQQYVKLTSTIKEYMPHPSVLTGPASEWTLR